VKGKEKQIRVADWQSIAPLLDQYIDQVSGVTDSFWEEKLLDAQVYVILCEKQEIGFFSVFKEETITSFYLVPEAYVMEQDLFRAALQKEFVRQALVPTCDEYFLSLCLDYAKGIERQAFFFERKRMDRTANGIELIEANLDDLDDVIGNSGDFFGDAKKQIEKREIFLAMNKNDLVGFGVYERGQLRKEFVSIGMYVLPKYRNKGLGTAIIQGLQTLAVSQGLEPIAGCWVWNHASKKTLEASGMGSCTRYMKITF